MKLCILNINQPYRKETWMLNSMLHREDGPAYEGPTGTKAWHLNGKRHREDGPAIEYHNGDKYWYLNDQRHRTDGPAVEHADGSKSWYLGGVEYTEKQFNKKMNPTVEMTIAEIEKLLGVKNLKITK